MTQGVDTHAATFRAVFIDSLQASRARPADAAFIFAQMLAMAHLFPRATASTPMGFFDPERELTSSEWRAFLVALKGSESTAALPRLHRRGRSHGGVVADFVIERHDGPLMIGEVKSYGLENEPGALERLRRIMLQALPPWNGNDRGPQVPQWLIHAVLVLAMDDRKSPFLLPQDDIQELIRLLVPRDEHRVVYCAFEGASGIALWLAAEGAERIELDLPHEDWAELIYHLAVACDLPLSVRVFHPVLETIREDDIIYDAAIAVPPLGSRYPLGSVAPQLPKEHSADALHLLALLRRTKGPFGYLTADGFLFRSAQSERFFRERLVVENSLSAVVSLPRGTFPRTAVNVSLLYRGHPGSHPIGTLLFVDARRDGDVKRRFSELPPNEIAELVLSRHMTKRTRLVELPVLLENDFNLLVERYVLAPDALDVRAALSRTRTVLLDDVAEIFRPQTFPVTDSDGIVFREVAAKDIDSATGVVQTPAKQVTLTREAAAKARRAVLETGDLILSIKGRIGVVGFIEDQPAAGEPWIPAQSFAVLRPRRSSAIGDPRVLYRYLTSPFGQKALRALAGGGTVPFLQIADVRRLEVPVPSPDDLDRIIEGKREISELNDQIILLGERMLEIEDSLWPMNLSDAAGSATVTDQCAESQR